jgi:hypothetical protein
MAERFGPPAFLVSNPGRVPDFDRFGMGAQVVNVPMQGFSRTQVTRDAAGQPARSTPTADIGIPAYGELEAAQTPNLDGGTAGQVKN